MDFPLRAGLAEEGNFAKVTVQGLEQGLARASENMVDHQNVASRTAIRADMPGVAFVPIVLQNSSLRCEVATIESA